MAELNRAYDTLNWTNDIENGTVGGTQVHRNEQNGVKPQFGSRVKRILFVLFIALVTVVLVTVFVTQLVILNRLKGSDNEKATTSVIKTTTAAAVATKSLTTTTIGTTQPAAECVTPWISYSHSCYLFGPEPMTFLLAVDYCQQNKAQLVHVEDHGENHFLRTYIIDHLKQSAWIGLTDVRTEGVYRWFGTTTVANFTDWATGQPTNAGKIEHCIHIYTPLAAHWNDADCNLQYVPICKRPYFVK